jgi:peptide-methionine (S)-S-oxide reductase
MAQSIRSWRVIYPGIPLLCVVLATLGACTPQPVQSTVSTKSETVMESSMKTEKAILAGGCFWGMEDLFRKQQGVVSTRVGYSGGDVKNATYQNHGTHAESIEVVYDPAQTDFRKLLEFFFQIHDPTTQNRQGNDLGTSYRSAIYYTSEEQKLVALDTIEDVNASGLWPGTVVTEVEPAGDFWEAEPEHQDYLARNPQGYTCHFPRKGWVLPKRGS